MLKEGILYYSTNGFSLWHKRYFKLKEFTLEQYSKNQEKQHRTYDLKGCKVRTVHPSLAHRKYAFQLSRNTDFFILLAGNNEKNMQEWMDMIRMTIHFTMPSPIESTATLISQFSLMKSKSMSPFIMNTVLCLEEDIVRITISEKHWINEILSNSYNQNEKFMLSNMIKINEKEIKKGSILIGFGKEYSLHLTYEMIRKELESITIPLQLCFIASRNYSGKVKMMSSKVSKFIKSPSSSTSSSESRTHHLISKTLRYYPWRPRCCEIEGDDLIIKKVSKPASRKVLSLRGANVKQVHQRLVGKENCFLLLLNGDNVRLFQARTTKERNDWMNYLMHAIGIANGHIHVPELDACNCLYDERENGRLFYPRNSMPTTDQSFLDRILYCQKQGLMLNALQLLKNHLHLRHLYWPKIFKWGLHKTPKLSFQQLQEVPVSSIEHAQILKDIPRTAQWLNHSKDAPSYTTEEMGTLLDNLRHVLRAYIAYSLHEETPFDEIASLYITSSDFSTCHSQYAQGMNGIAFILFSVLGYKEMEKCLHYLIGITKILLADIFSSETSLLTTGKVFESIISSHFPHLSMIFDTADLPLFILTYKWFPTLFSDLGFATDSPQLNYDTLLTVWDICFLLGPEGLYVISLAFFSFISNEIMNLSLDNTFTVEDLSLNITNSLACLTPEWLIDGVCIVLEKHPDIVLARLRQEQVKRLTSM